MKFLLVLLLAVGSLSVSADDLTLKIYNVTKVDHIMGQYGTGTWPEESDVHFRVYGQAMSKNGPASNVSIYFNDFLTTHVAKREIEQKCHKYALLAMNDERLYLEITLIGVRTPEAPKLLTVIDNGGTGGITYPDDMNGNDGDYLTCNIGRVN